MSQRTIANTLLIVVLWSITIIGLKLPTNLVHILSLENVLESSFRKKENTPVPHQALLNPTPSVFNSNLMGIQPYPTSSPNAWAIAIRHAQLLGFGWVKFSISWKELEPTRTTFSQQFALINQNILYAKSKGFKVLLTIAKAPNWARGCNPCQNDGPPEDPQDLASFVSNLISRVGVTSIDAIEVWNEPNMLVEWTGKPLDANIYRQYFSAVYNMVRSQSKDIVVISAGLAPTLDSQNALNDRDWLEQFYGGMLPINDAKFAIGVHPYGWANRPDDHCCASQGWDSTRQFFFLDTLNDYHGIMLRHGDQLGKLWPTEFGWASVQGLHVYSQGSAIPASNPELSLFWITKLTDEEQANYIVHAYQLAESAPLSAFVGPMFLFNLDFAMQTGYVSSNSPTQPDAAFSLLDSNGSPRIAYMVLQAIPKYR